MCRFVCTWSQTGRGGALLYTGRHASPPLQVVMAPSLLLEMEPGHTHLDTPTTTMDTAQVGKRAAQIWSRFKPKDGDPTPP